MTQEEKELLLKDLCGRLPYGVVCDRLGKPKKLLSISPYKVYCFEFDNGEYMPSEYKLDDIKPYLRSMETMTDDEFEELSNIYDCIVIKNNRLVVGSDDWCPPTFEESIGIIDWLNKKMFDYRGLIPMGLALPAPEYMYK